MYTQRIAETQAGITHDDYRGTHGSRRGRAGDIYKQTKSVKDAADWLGDKSEKVVREHCLLTRLEDLEETAKLISEERKP